MLDELISQIPPIDAEAAAAARRRQDRLTKPTGSLGRLEDLSIQIAGVTGQPLPKIDPTVIFVFAADHGVASARAVSAYPVEVTAQMVLNYAREGAVITVLARQLGARVVVADIGVASELPANLPIQHSKVRLGADDWTCRPAMSREDAIAAIEAGAECVLAESGRGGVGVACIGEMGIGNTTTAAVLAAAFLGLSPEDVAGKGTGLDSAGIARKVEAIRAGLACHSEAVQSGDPLAILSALGGLEIAAMAGAMIAAATIRAPVLIDGFISSVAALVALRLAPTVQPFLIAAHRSLEKGHRLVLGSLGLAPLLDLEMRLGEASGAALAVPILRASVAILRETATFDEAGVSDKEEAS
jgi:nicotinate-nucleotide--dimethylbenzimidazole phosphoribosyltransferase